MLSVATKIFALGVVAFSLQGCDGNGHNNNSTPKDEPVDLPQKDMDAARQNNGKNSRNESIEPSSQRAQRASNSSSVQQNRCVSSENTSDDSTSTATIPPPLPNLVNDQNVKIEIWSEDPDKCGKIEEIPTKHLAHMFVMNWSNRQANQKNHKWYNLPFRANLFGSKNHSLSVKDCKCKLNFLGQPMALGYPGSDETKIDNADQTFDVKAFELENRWKNKSRDKDFHKMLRKQVKNATDAWINFNREVHDYLHPVSEVGKKVKLRDATVMRLIEWQQFKINPEFNSDLQTLMTPAAPHFLSPVDNQRRWVSLHSGELDSPALPARYFKEGQWVIVFEEEKPFRFGRVNPFDTAARAALEALKSKLKLYPSYAVRPNDVDAMNHRQVNDALKNLPTEPAANIEAVVADLKRRLKRFPNSKSDAVIDVMGLHELVAEFHAISAANVNNPDGDDLAIKKTRLKRFPNYSTNAAQQAVDNMTLAEVTAAFAAVGGTVGDATTDAAAIAAIELHNLRERLKLFPAHRANPGAVDLMNRAAVEAALRGFGADPGNPGGDRAAIDAL